MGGIDLKDTVFYEFISNGGVIFTYAKDTFNTFKVRELSQAEVVMLKI